MPFQDLDGFDDDAKRAMGQAFIAVCDRLGLQPDDPERQAVAEEIIALAARGERDAAMLFTLALEALDG
jgi:hypothetical protein